MQPKVSYELYKDETDESIIAKIELYDRDLSIDKVITLMDFFDADFFERV